MTKNLEGHMLAGRLKPEEKECVHELTRNLVPPKNILSTLKERNQENKTSMKQIYNARQRYKHDVRGEMSELQQLLKCLEDHIGTSTSLEWVVSRRLYKIYFGHIPIVEVFDVGYILQKQCLSSMLDHMW
jgi:hypothetical protein